MTTDSPATLDLLSDLIARARRAGADAADAVHVEGTSIAHAQRLGETEKLERSEGQDLGLRVLVGRRQAVVSSSDLGRRALDELVERAVAMARVVPEDPYCGLAEPEAVARDWPDMDLSDPVEPSAETLIDWARRAEEAARAVPGVTNSEGAEAGWSRSRVSLVASNGFAGSYEGSGWSLSVSVLAGEGTGMERDYDFTSAVYGSDLRPPEDVGRSAGERAVRRLGPRKVATAKLPVVFDPRVSGGLVGHFAGAVNGQAIARGTSFLKDRMDQPVFAPGVAVIDDPLRPRGLRSRPFDGEGLPARRRSLVEDGVLRGWVLDLRSARQLGLASTGNAARGTGGPPSPTTTNLYLAAGSLAPDALLRQAGRGLYVTGLMGFGVNGVTGDYSRGASGFWIEDGRIAHPVSEVTIAGNLKDMFRTMVPANDLEFRYGTNAPTVLVPEMTVAGR
ncbi:TldD/PmbA family protein [Stella sp.]|uniref:TldD/PmbA family protein n=1 Tax=Stella sp. TaxID=2912054 RepID=UPI0035B27913